MKIKNKFPIWGLIMVGLLTFSFTEKEIKSTFPTGLFTATLNDSISKSWTTSYYTKQEGVDVINIFALTEGNVSLKISIKANAVGEYPVNGRNCSATYYVSESDMRNGINGIVTITSLENNQISGTFSFSDGLMENGSTFTNGTFTDVPLQ